jgi:hypothetical protein
LQHFTGTLDNWDPAVTDPLAQRGEVIVFESAGIGRSTGKVPETVAGMAKHALAFLDGLGLDTCDVLGFSLVAWSHNKWRWIVNRLLERREDREPVSGPEVAQAQMMAFRDWEKFTGKRFADLAAIRPAGSRRERNS